MNGVEYHVRVVLAATGRGRAASAVNRFVNQQLKVMKLQDRMQRRTDKADREAARLAREREKRLREISRNMQQVSASIGQAGRGLESIGRRMQGQTLSTAKNLAQASVAAGALGGAYGLGRALKSSLDVNEQLETTKIKLGAAQQLMGWFKPEDFGAKGLDKAAQSAEMLEKNMALAGTQMQRVFEIATNNPATFAQSLDFYQAMMPGMAAVTTDVNRITNAFEGLLGLGMFVEDFEIAGSQISRIMTGGAGAEFETWKKLMTPVLAAGKEKGYFDKNLQYGEKVTQAFNKLTGEQRLELVEMASEPLKALNEAWKNSWVGMKSAVESTTMLLQKSFGSNLFEGIKPRTRGFLDKMSPGQRMFQQFDTAARVWGTLLSEPLLKMLDVMFTWLERIGNNWQMYSVRLLESAEIIYQAAGMLIKLAFVKSGMGVATEAIGRGVQGVGWIGEVVSKLITLRWAGLALGVAMAAAAAWVGGLVVAVGGLVAWWVDNWGKISQAFVQGQITLQPVLQALADLWAKFLAVGQVMMGTNDPIQGANKGIAFLTRMITGLTDTFGMLLRVGGYVDVVLRNIAGLFVSLVGTIMTVVSTAIYAVVGTLHSIIPKALLSENDNKLLEGAKAFQTWSSKTAAAGFGMFTTDSPMLEYADAWDKAKGEMVTSDWGAKLAGIVEKFVGPAEVPNPQQPKEKPPELPAGNTNIYISKVVNDLRNHDPDRIIGVFAKGMHKAVQRPVAAKTLPRGNG